MICNTPPNACQQPTGTCEAGTGRCTYNPGTDGTSCGVGESSRCCSGTCVNTAMLSGHCGGCGLACAMGETCQAIEQSQCITPEPANTSGRCTCSQTAGCPGNQTCGLNNTCVPAAVSQCAPGQILGMAPIGCAAYCRY